VTEGRTQDDSSVHFSLFVFQEVVPLLLEQRPELLHEKNDFGWPPLYVAAYSQRSEVVAELLRHGADLACTVRKTNFNTAQIRH